MSGERSLVGRLGMFDRRKKRSEFFGRVFVLVLVKFIRVPFGGDLREQFMGMGRLDEKCSLLIERCRAGRLSLLFVVRQGFRPIGSLGCVGCCIALCLSSQRNVISFSAHCVCHRSLSRLSSQSVLFIAVSFCGVSCSCFLVDLFPCPLVCVGMLSSRGLLSVRLAAL